MSTPRRRHFSEGVNAFLASLFLIAIGLATGLLGGIGLEMTVTQQQVSAGFLSLAGKLYRVTPD